MILKNILKICKKNSKLNKIMAIKDKNYYIWPASAHTVALFVNGLDYTLLDGILDNSPNKINKYLYGYNLECNSFNELLNANDPNNCIIIGGSGNYIKELNFENIKTSIIFLKKYNIKNNNIFIL